MSKSNLNKSVNYYWVNLKMFISVKVQDEQYVMAVSWIKQKYKYYRG